GNYEADPDHEAEQADDVDGGELADALLPQLLEVGQDADREERQDEKDHPERVGFADCGRDLRGDIPQAYRAQGRDRPRSSPRSRGGPSESPASFPRFSPCRTSR